MTRDQLSAEAARLGDDILFIRVASVRIVGDCAWAAIEARYAMAAPHAGKLSDLCCGGTLDGNDRRDGAWVFRARLTRWEI